jgi:hypothetical protein
MAPQELSNLLVREPHSAGYTHFRLFFFRPSVRGGDKVPGQSYRSSQQADSIARIAPSMSVGDTSCRTKHNAAYLSSRAASFAEQFNCKERLPCYWLIAAKPGKPFRRSYQTQAMDCAPPRSRQKEARAGAHSQVVGGARAERCQFLGRGSVPSFFNSLFLSLLAAFHCHPPPFEPFVKRNSGRVG